MYILPTLGFVLGLLTFLFVIVCLFMMLVILIQKPRGGGLTGAFGGAGGSATSVFGAKTGDVLTWFTVVCFVLFILLAMGLTWAGRPGDTLDTPIIESTPTTNPFGTPGTPGTPATPGTGAPSTSDSSKDSLLPSDRTPVKTPETPAKDETPAK